MKLRKVVRVTGLETVRLMSTRPSNVPVYQFQHTRVNFRVAFLGDVFYYTRLEAKCQGHFYYFLHPEF